MHLRSPRIPPVNDAALTLAPREALAQLTAPGSNDRR